MLSTIKLDYRPEAAWTGVCGAGCGRVHIYFAARKEGSYSGKRWIRFYLGPCGKGISGSWKWCDDPPDESTRRLMTHAYLVRVEETGIDEARLFVHTRVPPLRKVRWTIRFIVSGGGGDGPYAKVAMVKENSGSWRKPCALPKNIGNLFTAVGKATYLAHDLKFIDHSQSSGPETKIIDSSFKWDLFSHEERSFQATIEYRTPHSEAIVKLITKKTAEIARKKVKVLLDALLGRS